MWSEFKAFIMKGNVLDLAVAVIIGTAFGKIVEALTTHVLMPLIAAIAGKASFAQMSFSIGKSQIVYGAVLQALFDFFIVAFVLFIIIKAYNMTLRKPALPQAPKPPTESELLTEIRDLLKAK